MLTCDATRDSNKSSLLLAQSGQTWFKMRSKSTELQPAGVGLQIALRFIDIKELIARLAQHLITHS
jgi:hypothetical protein